MDPSLSGLSFPSLDSSELVVLEGKQISSKYVETMLSGLSFPSLDSSELVVLEGKQISSKYVETLSKYLLHLCIKIQVD